MAGSPAAIISRYTVMADLPPKEHTPRLHGLRLPHGVSPVKFIRIRSSGIDPRGDKFTRDGSKALPVGTDRMLLLLERLQSVGRLQSSWLVSRSGLLSKDHYCRKLFQMEQSPGPVQASGFKRPDAVAWARPRRKKKGNRRVGALSARPLRSESFQCKRGEVFATAPRPTLDVGDRYPDTLLSLELKRRAKFEWLRKRMRESEHRVDGA
jgi:hypothetical protein